MKKSEKIRLIIAVLIGCLAIFLTVWFRFGAPAKDPGVQISAEAVSQSDAASEELSAENAATGTEAEKKLYENRTDTGSTAAGVDQSGQKTNSGSSASSAQTAKTSAAVAGHDISGNSLYKSNTVINYADRPAKKPQDPEAVLNEMRGFWDSTGLDALRDLWVLDRYQQMTLWLSEHEDTPYFYSGDKNASGLPEGRGIAVYSGNRYYYGEWKNGKREGAGDWYQFYPERMQDVVILHEYTGNWKNDLPNGEGIDVYEYDLSRMDLDTLYPMNFIGSFTDGLCDGEMLVMLEDAIGKTTSWKGTCVRGVWQPVDGNPDVDGGIQALYYLDDPKQRIRIWPEYNKEYGVYHVR
ncbi:MAG: hypothetical protein K6G16_00570 [Lachnospiraceae bacterium]|nr:hypothetical protein [Lachnospiraceae bacterium]